MKSMTAFGRAVKTAPLGRCSVEIQSVNRKHLEIATMLPREFRRFDPQLKKWIAARISRGSVQVTVSMTFEQGSPLTVTPNIPLALQLKSAWEQVNQALKLKPEHSFELSLLMNEPAILIYEEDLQDEQACFQILQEAVEEALNYLEAMKDKEGAALQMDIEERLANMEAAICHIELKAPGAVERYRKKIHERLLECATGGADLNERLLREVCLFAEKVDVAEEITRFKSHLLQSRDLVCSKGAIGKTLEFLLQELLREVNTIGSKAADVEVTKQVIEIKSQLEKAREQIQNIE